MIINLSSLQEKINNYVERMYPENKEKHYKQNQNKVYKVNDKTEYYNKPYYKKI